MTLLARLRRLRLRQMHRLLILALPLAAFSAWAAEGADPDRGAAAWSESRGAGAPAEATAADPQGSGAPAQAVPGVPAIREVARCDLSGTVDAGSAAFLVDCVQRVEAGGYEALLIRLDTPGGALESTREIVQAFLGSKVPVLVWVGPSGARAGSAGVFLTLASNLAAMAPGTNIGAAHPVMGGGQDPEEAGQHMAEKIVNDTSAFAEAIAKQRGRNESWAVEAVRDSASITADRAVELKVVELLAATELEFLQLAEGREVQVPDGKRILRTAGARIVPFEPSTRQALVHWLANPSVAYILFLIGGLGIAIEVAHPGGIAPGLVGAICIILAMIAFSSLPIRAGGIMLILIGLAMIVAELFVASGLLGAGGVALLILGGLFLVDRFDGEWFVEPSFGIPWFFVLPIAVFAGGAAIYVVLRTAQARKLPQRGGDLGLIGQVGRALSAIDERGGEVFVHGERWRAVSPKPIAPESSVVVRQVDGLTIHVEEEVPA